MSNYKSKIKKNIEKNKKKKKEKYPTKNKILLVSNIFFGIVVVVILSITISFIANNKYNFDDKETKISTDEIIAGQTFNRKNEVYYVLFYSEEDSKQLKETLSSITPMEKLYKVNLDSLMNKDIVSDKTNPKASNPNELKVKNPTLIRIENGKNVDYIEGLEKVEEYLHRI